MGAVLKRIQQVPVEQAVSAQRLPKKKGERMQTHGAKEKLFPMEALLVERLPEGNAWRYEPKWDGFRRLAFKRDHAVTLLSKSGKTLERYFPDIVSRLRTGSQDVHPRWRVIGRG